MVTLVAGSGVLLGYAGFFSGMGFFVTHVTALIGILLWKRSSAADLWLEAKELLFSIGRSLKADVAVRWMVFAISVFLVATGFLALMSEPGIYDSLSYRLSRIAHWMQEGEIGFIITNDPRQNYMPVVPDIMMAWFLGVSPVGYSGTALAQWFGGGMMLLAIVGLGRHLSLGRAASLGAAVIALGMANVSVQFTTTQTDLFTSGVAASAFYLFVISIKRGAGSVVAGLGAGLALGAKGTLYYLLPSILIWAVWYGARHRLQLGGWARTAFPAFIAVLIFVIPGVVRNLSHYGGCFGPATFVSMHHQGGPAAQLPYKLGINLYSSLIQSFDAPAQPLGLRSFCVGWGRKLAEKMPTSDQFMFLNMSRRGHLLSILGLSSPDADCVSMGLLSLFLFALVLGRIALARVVAEERVMCCGIVLFIVFYHVMQQWHGYGFRYFVLIAPWMCVLIACFVSSLPRVWRICVWCLVGFSSITVSWNMLSLTQNAGWRVAISPDTSAKTYAYRQWRAWLSELEPKGDTIYVALPFNRELAPFYRRQGQNVRLVRVEEFAGLSARDAVKKLDGDWLIVSPLQFVGNEEGVVRKTWLFSGEAGHLYSLVAYRRADVSE